MCCVFSPTGSLQVLSLWKSKSPLPCWGLKGDIFISKHLRVCLPQENLWVCRPWGCSCTSAWDLGYFLDICTHLCIKYTCMPTHIQAHGERVSFQGLIVIQCSSKGVYSTFLMHPFASGLHPQWGFCATLDSPVPGVPHTQACALRQKLISDLASPIFFWSTTHIHWHFRSVWETLLYLLCAFISIFHQGIIQSLPFFFGFFFFQEPES